MAKPKVELTQEQIVEKIERRRELGQLRSKIFYENNKAKVLSRVKEYNQQIKQKYQNIIKNIKPTEPAQPQPQNENENVDNDENENDDETFYLFTPKKKQSKKTKFDLQTILDLMENLEYNSVNTKATHIRNIKTFF